MRPFIASAIGIGAAVLGTACSLVHPSSDYSGTTATLDENGIPADALARVFVLFGQRDAPTALPDWCYNSTTDVLYTDVGADGVLDPWKHGNSSPLMGDFRAVRAHDAILAFGIGPEGGKIPRVVRAPLAADGVGDWSITAGDPLPEELPLYSTLTLGSTAGYLLGGAVDLSEQGGSCHEPVPDTKLFAVDPESGEVGAMRPSTPLARPRYYLGSLAHGSMLYVVGGTTSEGANVPYVEMAPIGSDGSIGAYQELPDLPDGEGGTFGIRRPTLCAGEGHFYVVGGEVGDDKSDVVIHAPIGESGALGDWSVVTPLPGTHVGGGCFVAGGRLYVIGGEGTTSYKDTVVMAEVSPDGSLSPTWDATSNPKLPFARAGFSIVTVPAGG